MKSKKKLNLKKMNIAQLGATKGGNIDWTYPTTGTGFPTANPTGCGNGTQGLACQYSQAPTSCVHCVHMER